MRSNKRNRSKSGVYTLKCPQLDAKVCNYLTKIITQVKDQKITR